MLLCMLSKFIFSRFQIIPFRS